MGTFAGKTQCPVLSLPASNDEEALKPGGQFMRAVQEKQPGSRSREFTRMLHGWVCRGVESDAVIQQTAAASVVAEDQQMAVNEAATFFKEVVSGEITAAAPQGNSGTPSSHTSSSPGSSS